MVQSSFDLDFNREVVGLYVMFTPNFESLKTKQYGWSYHRLNTLSSANFCMRNSKGFCDSLTELVDS